MDVPLGLPRSSLELRIQPNPAHARTRVHFALPKASLVSIEVLDLQGRRMASVLDHSLRFAGEQHVDLRTEGWRAGLYLCRIEAGDAVAIRKVLVVP